ncbi:MAG: hypothetical protein AB7V19_06155 [Candidatus Bipolaricaulia bacterium]
MNDLSEQVARLAADKQEAEADLQTAQEALRVAGDESAALRMQVSGIVAEKTKSDASLRSTQEALNAAEGRVAALEGQLFQATSARERAMADLGSVQNSVAVLRKENTDLAAQLAELIVSNEELEAKLLAANTTMQSMLAYGTQTPSDPGDADLTSEGRILYSDTFDHGLVPVWSLASGDWEARAGDLHLRNPGNGYAYILGGESWTDYSVEADVSVPKDKPGSDYWMELVIRARDDLNKVSLAFDQDNLLFLTYVDGERRFITASRAVPGAPAGSHIRVMAMGDRFSCYVNGTLRAHLETPDFPAGTAGVAVYGSGGRDGLTHRFDNFVVRALP